MDEASNKVLVIDDEADVGEFVSAAAKGLGLECAVATNASALRDLVTPDVSLILLDLMMPEMDGIEALRLLSELRCTAGIVLMSGINKRVMETAEKLARTLGLFIAGHLAKPFELPALEEVLGRYRASAPPIRSLSGPRVLIRDERLRMAVERDEFVVHYQPQIDIASREVIGFEALVRWRDPERGLIFPDSFIGRAEELGLIDEVGWLVANRAFGELKQLRNGTGKTPRLALNASAQSLRDLKFPDRFEAMLAEHELAANGLVLEITESGLLNDMAFTLDVLTRLRMKNIQLSIDDFGTGYAMMQQLVDIPATELKIDRAFVLNMHQNSSDRIMVEKSIEIGHELGMKVIAEGVETEESLNFLSERGCDSVQGYLFTRPLPPGELVQWLHAYNLNLKR